MKPGRFAPFSPLSSCKSSRSYIPSHTWATISNERSRAAWSWICAVIISSSAPVRSANRSSPARTVAGEPTTAHASASSASRAPAATSRLDSRSTGGGSGPGVPRRRLTNCLLLRGEQQGGFVVGLGGEDVDAGHHVRLLERRGGLEACAVDLERRPSGTSGAKCEANA